MNKAEISHNIYSAHSSPQPSSSQNTSSTNQSNSTTSGNGGGPHLTVPGLSGHSRTPSPEPSSGNSRDSLDYECLPEKHFENGNGSAVPVAVAPPRTHRRTLRQKTLQSAEEIARKRQALKGNIFFILSSNQYMACTGFCQLGMKREKADLKNFFIQEDSDNALIPYILLFYFILIIKKAYLTIFRPTSTSFPRNLLNLKM